MGNEGGAGSLVMLLTGGGITCLVFGIMYLSSPNNFEANKRAYITNIADFQDNNYGRLQQSTAILDASTTMSADVTFVNNFGKNAPLMPQNVESLALKASGINWTLNHTMSIRFPGSGALVLDAPSPPNQSIGVVKVKCNNGKNGCDKYKMREACQKASCPDAMLFSGPGKAGSGEVKNCFFMEWTPYVCMVVDAADDGSWRLNPTKRYCDWPFTSVRRACGYANATIPYLIRASNDPYVVAQELTQGRMDFGLTSSQQILYGGLLVAGGIVLLIIDIVGLLCFVAAFCDCAKLTCGSSGGIDASASEPDFAAANPPVVEASEPVVGEAVVVEEGGSSQQQEMAWKDFDLPEATTAAKRETV